MSGLAAIFNFQMALFFGVYFKKKSLGIIANVNTVSCFPEETDDVKHGISLGTISITCTNELKTFGLFFQIKKKEKMYVNSSCYFIEMYFQKCCIKRHRNKNNRDI